MAAAGSSGKQIYAYFGSDEGRIKEEALRTCQKFAPEENPDFGLEIINGSAETSEHAGRIIGETIQSIQTPPFLGGDKVVWLQNANFFGDTVTGRAQATQRGLEQLVETLDMGLMPGIYLVISGTTVDKRRATYKKLTKIGDVQVIDLPDPSRPGWEREVMGLAKKRAHVLQFAFEQEALELFVMMTGETTLQLDNELEKLALYLGDRNKATTDDVRAVVATTRAGIIFEIGDAIAERNLPRTIDLIEHQLRRGESAIGILLAAIVPRVRSLLQARDIYETYGIKGNNYGAYQSAINRLPESAKAHLPRKKDGGISAYPIFLAADKCSRFTLAELKDALIACMEANRQLVTTQTEERTVLSQLATRILIKPV